MARLFFLTELRQANDAKAPSVTKAYAPLSSVSVFLIFAIAAHAPALTPSD